MEGIVLRESMQDYIYVEKLQREKTEKVNENDLEKAKKGKDMEKLQR